MYAIHVLCVAKNTYIVCVGNTHIVSARDIYIYIIYIYIYIYIYTVGVPLLTQKALSARASAFWMWLTNSPCEIAESRCFLKVSAKSKHFGIASAISSWQVGLQIAAPMDMAARESGGGKGI
jgi:hypothetical protein